MNFIKVFLKKAIDRVRLKSQQEKNVMANMMVLVVGVVSAKAIGTISLPIITRLYTPHDFGLFSIAGTFISIVIPLTTMKYEIAIPLTKNDRLAINQTVLCFGMLLLFTSMLAATLLLLNVPIFSYLNAEEYGGYWPLIVFIVFFGGLYEILTMWATRKKDFRFIAKAEATQSLSSALTKIALAFTAFKSVGLISGLLLQYVTGVTVLLFNFLRSTRRRLADIKVRRIRFLLAWFSNMPKYRLPSHIILMMSTKAPIIYCAIVFDSVTVGLVSLALAIVGLPVMLLGQTIGKAYYGEVARVGRKQIEDLKKLTRSTAKNLILLSLMPFLIIFFFGEQLFSLVFGGDWQGAGTYASIFSTYMLFQFISSPLMSVLNVLNKQYLYFRINLTRFVMVCGALLFAYIYGLNAENSLIIYSIVLALCYLTMYFRIYSAIK